MNKVKTSTSVGKEKFSEYKAKKVIKLSTCLPAPETAQAVPQN